jgi:crotonobetainyl-CoA:carnitine CoA-transferase CaiB-like acyl-CoA transferase
LPISWCHFTAYGILAALVGKLRLGVSQKVDVSHLGSMMALQGLDIGMGLYVSPVGFSSAIRFPGS